MHFSLVKVQQIDGVYSCRDVHVWTHGASTVVCTMHVELATEANEQRTLSLITGIAREAGITHVTVEFHKELVRRGN